ncbi:hypothetical protein AMTRI_Chr07g23770 [Amborella trichopoda]
MEPPPEAPFLPAPEPPPASGGFNGFLGTCLWCLCCCGLFQSCCPPLFEPGPMPPP